MGFMLLWFEHLLVGLALAAFGLALAARTRSTVLRWCLIFTLLVAPLLATVGLAVAETWLHWRLQVELGLRNAALVTALALITGVTFIAARGLRRNEFGELPARSWPLSNLTLGLIVTGLLYSLTFWNLDLAARQRMDALRQEAGTLALSVAPPRAPDRENAALRYQQLFDSGILSPKPPAYEDWLRGILDEGAEFDPQAPELVAYVQRQAPLLARFREATQLPSCSFVRDWSRIDVSMLLAETQHAREAARELALEARVLAARGDLFLAFADLAAIHRLADHVGQEPLYVSQLVAIALDAIADRNLEWLLQHHRVAANDLAPLDGWQPLSLLPRRQRAALAEEALGLAVMSELAGGSMHGGSLEPLGLSHWDEDFNSIYRVFLSTADMQAYRRYMRETQVLAHRPYADRMKAYDQMEQSLKSRPGGILTRLLVPGHRQFDEAVARAEARQRLAYLALAAHRYRLQVGAGSEFPADLDQLVQTGLAYLPTDPFNGAPLKQLKRGDEWVLYSVGPNQQDDGGAKYVPETREGDIIFVLKLPPP